MNQSDEKTSRANRCGILDNTTIIRFSHATSDGAGTESHLECLNQILLQRNQMTILYLYMPDNNAIQETQYIGKGRLVRIPMKYKKQYPTDQSLFQRIKVKCLSVMPGTSSFIPYLREAVGICDIAQRLFSSHHINLLVNHFPGSKDSLAFMKETAIRKVPILVMNHFHNNWYNKTAIRRQLKYAQMVAGLSNIKMPRYLRSRFVNLSNGIDTNYFDPALSISSDYPKNRKPILVLPARIVKNKGQKDLLKIVARLKNNGLDCTAVFVGRYDSPAYKAELDSFIQNHNLKENVIFTGVLSADSLRQWYAKSALMILPTYHDEGLPRVVLESQSMCVPPICYSSGGVPESILQRQTGYYVKKGDISDMCRFITELLNNENKRLVMGKNGRKFILNNFSLTSLAERHELTYFRLIHALDNL